MGWMFTFLPLLSSTSILKFFFLQFILSSSLHRFFCILSSLCSLSYFCRLSSILTLFFLPTLSWSFDWSQICLVCSFFSFSCRSVCCTAPWRRLSWFSRQPGRRVRPGPVTCGSPWDRPCPAWAWRGCPRPCSPSGRRAGGTSHDGKNSFLFIFT